MRKFAIGMLVLVAVLGTVLAGCTKQQARADLVACADCGGKVEAATLKDVDGRKVCSSCAAKIEAAKGAAPGAQADQHACVVCGMQMKAADMVEVDGKWYCSHCKPAGAGEAGAGEGGAEGHGTGGA